MLAATTSHGDVCVYLNIDIFLGRSLEELHAQLIGQLLAALKRNHALVFHITLVTDQYHLCVVPRICLYLSDPGRRER